MRTQPATEKDPAPALVPPVRPSMPWRVVSVKPLPEFGLHVQFFDGTQGEVSLASLILGLQAGVFAVLRDQGLFNQVYIEHGAVTWPGELDLAPDAMYAQVKRKV